MWASSSGGLLGALLFPFLSLSVGNSISVQSNHGRVGASLPVFLPQKGSRVKTRRDGTADIGLCCSTHPEGETSTETQAEVRAVSLPEKDAMLSLAVSPLVGGGNSIQSHLPPEGAKDSTACEDETIGGKKAEAVLRNRCLLLQSRLLELVAEASNLRQRAELADARAAASRAASSKLKVELQDAKLELEAAEKFVEGLKSKYTKELRLLEADSAALQRSLRRAEDEMGSLRDAWNKTQAKLEAESRRYRTRNILLTEELRKARDKAADARQAAAWLDDEKVSLERALLLEKMNSTKGGKLQTGALTGVSAVDDPSVRAAEDLKAAEEEVAALQEQLSQARASAAEREVDFVKLEGELRRARDEVKRKTLGEGNAAELEHAKKEILRLGLELNREAQTSESEHHRMQAWREKIRATHKREVQSIMHQWEEDVTSLRRLLARSQVSGPRKHTTSERETANARSRERLLQWHNALRCLELTGI
jgi:hypothetical protein